MADDDDRDWDAGARNARDSAESALPSGSALMKLAPPRPNVFVAGPIKAPDADGYIGSDLTEEDEVEAEAEADEEDDGDAEDVAPPAWTPCCNCP